MKYSINGFRQEKALELGLDYIDLQVLRWLTDHYLTLEKMVADRGVYAMVNCKMIVDDLPLLGISERDVLARLSKMIKVEILGQYLLPYKRVINLNNLGAEMLYLFFDKNYKLLLCD